MKIDVLCRLCGSKLRAPILSGRRDDRNDVWIEAEPCRCCIERATGRPFKDSIPALRGLKQEED